MLQINRTRCQCAPVLGRPVPDRPSITLVVKGSFSLVPGQPAVPLDQPQPFSGDRFRDEDPALDCLYESDFAPFKPHAEILLTGTAHQPYRQAAPTCIVRVSVGGWSKQLLVLGPRKWKSGFFGSSPGDPSPFTSCPLDYSEAAGGSEHRFNRAGKGCGTEEMPRVEDSRNLLLKPKERHEPAGFGPRSPYWPARTDLLGTYDNRWLKERWPWFPKDFDWSYWNAAPLDQQFSGYLVGDEAFGLTNLHPDQSELTGWLPGRRVRCFLDRDESGQPGFREVPLNLDTLHIDADQMILTLQWRGVAFGPSDDPGDFGRVLLIEESVSESPRPAEQYAPLFSEPAPIHAEAEAAVPAPPALEPPEFDQALAQLRQALESATQQFTAQGVDISKQLTQVAPLPSPDRIPAALTGFIEGLTAEGLAVPPALSQALAAISADPLLAAWDKLAVLPEPAAIWTPETFAAELGRRVDWSGEPLAGLDLAGLDLSGRRFCGAHLAGAKLAGAKLGAADFTGADLTGADLTGADLAGATLTEADLSDANLSGTRLSGCRGSKALLRGATLAGADLTRADFREADLSESTLDQARLIETLLTDASIERAHGQAVDASGAEVTRLKAALCQLPGAVFRGATGPGSVWEEAQLEGADFSQAILDGAQFVKADLEAARFERAHLKNAVFRKARLTHAVLWRANLFRGSLEATDLEGADLRQANLYQVEFWQSAHQQAVFSGANLKGTKLADRD